MNATNAAGVVGSSAKPGKYLTFNLGHESYGLPVLKVREIIRMVKVTPIPNTLDFIQGVINLRGKLIPVMDLRIRFKMATHAMSDSTCTVVAQVKGSTGACIQMGFVVDGVEEVLNLAAEDIEKTPDFGAKVGTEYLLGMGNVKGKVIALLDIDKVIDPAAVHSLTGSLSPQSEFTANP